MTWHRIGQYASRLPDEASPHAMVLALPYIGWDRLTGRENLIQQWAAAASAISETEDVAESVVDTLLQIASQRDLLSHLPVEVWSWLTKSRPLPPVCWGRDVGSCTRVIQAVRALEDIEILKSYFLLIWSEWNCFSLGDSDGAPGRPSFYSSDSMSSHPRLYTPVMISPPRSYASNWTPPPRPPYSPRTTPSPHQNYSLRTIPSPHQPYSARTTPSPHQPHISSDLPIRHPTGSLDSAANRHSPHPSDGTLSRHSPHTPDSMLHRHSTDSSDSTPSRHPRSTRDDAWSRYSPIIPSRPPIPRPLYAPSDTSSMIHVPYVPYVPHVPYVPYTAPSSRSSSSSDNVSRSGRHPVSGSYRTWIRRRPHYAPEVIPCELEMHASIREDFGGIGMGHHRAELIQHLDEVLEQLGHGLEYLKQHNPELDKRSLRRTEGLYEALRRTLLEVETEAICRACRFAITIVPPCVLTRTLDAYRITGNVYVCASASMPIVSRRGRSEHSPITLFMLLLRFHPSDMFVS